MTSIQRKLFELQDKEYAQFQSKITPTVNADLFIGVRVPKCRMLAKELYKNNAAEVEAFFCELPHKYYDENLLHGLLISEIKDFNQCMSELNKFLPYVDNWSVCDIMSPKCFKKNKTALLPAVKDWVKSPREYTIRFGIEMLMSHFLDDDFMAEYLEIVAAVRSDKYYVNMMVAWFFATALTKQWDSSVKYIENNKLDSWVHNKTIQKARESYRITDAQKQYLLTLKLTTA